MNARAFEKCFLFLDPRLLVRPGAVTQYQYETTLAEFMTHVREVRVRTVCVTGLHLNEPSKLYEGRDFALGKTEWEDVTGTPHEFAERWVCERGVWYTRSSGLVLPEGVNTPAPDIHRTKSAPSPKEYITNYGVIVRKGKPLKVKKAVPHPPTPVGSKKTRRS